MWDALEYHKTWKARGFPLDKATLTRTFSRQVDWMLLHGSSDQKKYAATLKNEFKDGRISAFWEQILHTDKLRHIEKKTAVKIRKVQAQHHLSVANRMLKGDEGEFQEAQANVVTSISFATSPSLSPSQEIFKPTPKGEMQGNGYKKSIASKSHTVVSKKRKNDKDDLQQDMIVEDLDVDMERFPALFDYCQALREMQNSHVDEVSQRGQHLSRLLKWSVVDGKFFRMPIDLPKISRPTVNLDNLHAVLMEDPTQRFLEITSILRRLVAEGRIDKVTWIQALVKRCLGLQDKNDHIIYTPTALSAIMSVALYTPLPCRGPGSQPSERHVIAQVWTRIMSDAFTLHEVRFEPVWEHHQLLPGLCGAGSARSDFAAVVLNENQQQFPFFIVEFQQNGFEIHKDYAVVVCEAVFEMNRVLAMAPLSSDEVTTITIHVAHVNDTFIRLGRIKPLYNETKTALLYRYDEDVANFELHSGHLANDIENALRFVVYLREVVCHDGLIIRNFLTRQPACHDRSIAAALPLLPKNAEKSREATTNFTPQHKRMRYTYGNSYPSLTLRPEKNCEILSDHIEELLEYCDEVVHDPTPELESDILSVQ